MIILHHRSSHLAGKNTQAASPNEVVSDTPISRDQCKKPTCRSTTNRMCHLTNNSIP